MATFWRRRGRPPHPEILTPSEQRVLELIREGKTNSEIAYALSISIPGVKWHVSNMLGKLGVADRHQLAAWKGGAAAGSPGSRTGAAGIGGWLGWKVAAGAVAGVAVAGVLVVAPLVGSADEQAPLLAATPVPPQPPTTFVATVEFADALSTKVRLELQLATLPTDDYMLSIEGGYAIYADGDHTHDYAQTMRLMEGGANRSDGGTFAIEFAPIPAGTQFIEVELNGNLRRVAMTQAEADRQKTPGAQYFAAVPPGTGARAAVVRDPIETDLTDRAPKELDSGLGWKYVLERVTATSTRLGVTYRVEGIAKDRLYPDFGRNIEADGELRFHADPETTLLPLAGDGSPLVFAIGPASRWVDEPIRAMFTRSGAGWTTWSATFGLGSFAATLSDGPGIVVRESSAAMLFGGSVAVTLSDDLGRVYPNTGSTGGIPTLDLKFEGPLDSDATTVTLNINGYWVPETREWTVEIPVR